VGQNPPKAPKIGPNRLFPAKMEYNIISLKRLKIQTSNFARRMTLKDTKPKNEKNGQQWRGLGHVAYFSNFGTPQISLERLKIQTSNFA